MKHILSLTFMLIYYLKYEVNSLGLPGPLVYVVTPSPKMPQSDKGRSVPFYYRNWIKRMDTPRNSTTTTTEKTRTPDLIFAEFETGKNNMKSIRKLLEKEKIDTTTTSTTTIRPIYVPDEETDDNDSYYGVPDTTTEKPKKVDMTDYFALYNNLYNTGAQLSPVYVPTSSLSSSPPTTPAPTTSTISHTPLNNIENVWHIIDSEKNNQNSGKWEEETITSEQPDDANKNKAEEASNGEDDGMLDENFAVPGFGTNPGNDAENESRAIRTEPNFRFPYVNLKPFKMKTQNKPLINNFSSSKNGQNMFTSLDNFYDLKNPVRGEAQDVVPMRQPIERYNPAQPYLPQQPYGDKSKQSSPSNPPPRPPPPPPSAPVRTVANLVPPPPPPAPVVTANDFPTPSTYESFPPYAPAAPAPSPRAPNPSFSMLQPPPDSDSDTSSDSAPDFSTDDNDNDSPSPDLGYRYKPPSPPMPQFFPTPTPTSKPFSGYSYDKPPMYEASAPPMMDMGNKPDFHGYHYNKPEPSAPPQDHEPVSYGHHDEPPPSYQPDYPDLIYDKHKPHGDGAGDMNGGDDMKGSSMGMKPPPAPPVFDTKPDMDSHSPPMDDSGFPHDFPGDFKFHHDFDDHDYHHHHHPTTTTTTETPRVNRYSYYYLGKKLYYLPLYFSVYFIVYVGALIIKAVLRHKIVYPNSWRPNDQTAGFFSKRSIESHLANENLHEITGRVTQALATAAHQYMKDKEE